MPANSSNPSAKFKFCKHCVAAPLSRLSSPPTTTTLSPLASVWMPPTVQPCLPITSFTSTTPSAGSLTVTRRSPLYAALYNSNTSLAAIFLRSGTDSVEMMPENHGATAGMKLTCSGCSASPPPGPVAFSEPTRAHSSRLSSRRLRWYPASLSWMWPVSAYGLTVPATSDSGVTLGIVSGRPSAAFWSADVMVPAPE